MSRKKPYSRKVLEGTIKPGRHPCSPPGAPHMKAMELKEPPAWIGKYGKQFWKRVAPTLIKLGLLTEIDQGAFEVLCETYHQTRYTRDLLEKEGLTVQDERKLPRKHPLWQVHREAKRQFLSMASEFGLQPSGRSKLDIKILDPEDEEFEQWLGYKPTGITKFID